MSRQPRPAKANPWPGYVLMAAVVAVCFYVLGQIMAS